VIPAAWLCEKSIFRIIVCMITGAWTLQAQFFWRQQGSVHQYRIPLICAAGNSVQGLKNIPLHENTK
jgi:hypothetical protein